MSTATAIAAPMIVVISVCWGSWVGVGVSSGEEVGVGEFVGGGVGVDTGISGECMLWQGRYGSVRKGTKLAVPRLESSSESKIFRLID